jgi:preprotein translocase subunit SecG
VWDLIRTHPRSTAWLVVAWMVTVLALLIFGPVIPR